MAMRFHQKRFFAYPSGAPSLHALSGVSSDSGYWLRKLEMDGLRAENAIVVASGVIERPGDLQARVAVAYAVDENIFLQVFDAPPAPPQALSTAKDGARHDAIRFELEAAPTCIFSIQARPTQRNSRDVFHGVIVCYADSMAAVGFVQTEADTPSDPEAPGSPCVRLSNEQFATFFPELAAFRHPVLAVDTLTSADGDQGWLAFGYLYNANDQASSSEMLVDSDSFDSIFAGIVADIDLDGEVELLLGTDSQVMLAYKQEEASVDCGQESKVKEPSVNDPSSVDGDAPPSSPLNIWRDVESTPTVEVADSRLPPEQSSSPMALDLEPDRVTDSPQDHESVTSSAASGLPPVARRRKWQRLPRSRWDMETFGAIYSLLWRDVNRDGVPELLVASSTGIYVYEADPIVVIQKLERVLALLAASPSAVADA
ncbi:hypothetical protein BBJ28_00000931 [Nothophytophthora sp. Chile5]|nr:hypothetical protein BBJ28_00000931 [Nothophytophthora sp. Chile5]